jgi:high-affinity iron transporter
MNDVGGVPVLIEHVWNINPILSDQSTFGQILAALFGYNGSPSLAEALAYTLYLALIMFGLWMAGKKTTSAARIQT